VLLPSERKKKEGGSFDGVFAPAESENVCICVCVCGDRWEIFVPFRCFHGLVSDMG
jgi:hypothetical protein